MRAATQKAAFVRWSVGQIVLTVVVLGYLSIVLLLPIGALAVQTVRGGSEVLRSLTEPEVIQSLLRSLLVAVAVTLLNTIFGLVGALVIVRQRFWGRRILDALVDIPLAVSPVMTGFAFLLVYGRGGLLTPVVEWFGWKVTFAMPGVLLATLFVTVPLSLRELGHVLAQLGMYEEEAAATLGASAWTTFWRITLPNVRHGLLFGVTMTAARALGEFGAVLVVGGAISGKTQTATTLIYASLEERRPVTAFGMAIVLCGLSAIVLLAMNLIQRRSVVPE